MPSFGSFKGLGPLFFVYTDANGDARAGPSERRIIMISADFWKNHKSAEILWSYSLYRSAFAASGTAQRN